MLSCAKNVVGSFTHTASPLLRQTTHKYALSNEMPFRSLSTYSRRANIDFPATKATFSPITIKRELFNKVNAVLDLHKEGLKILLPKEDPFRGPVCLQASTLLAALLENLEGVDNIQIKGSSSGKLLSVHQHVLIVYLAENGNEFLIDPSWLQFLPKNENSKSNTLPPVFIGTREELYEEIHHHLGPDKRTYPEKLLSMLGLNESPTSAPQVIDDNYRYAHQDMPWICSNKDNLLPK